MKSCKSLFLLRNHCGFVYNFVSNSIRNAHTLRCRSLCLEYVKPYDVPLVLCLHIFHDLIPTLEELLLIAHFARS